MSKKIILSVYLLLICVCIFSAPLIVSAQSSIIDPQSSQYQEGNYTLTNILEIVIGASRWVLGIVGSLALIMFIYGGFTFLISAGSSEKITQAKKIITAAVVGLIIVFSSYLIIAFVLGSLGLGWDGTAVTPAKSKPMTQVIKAK